MFSKSLSLMIEVGSFQIYGNAVPCLFFCNTDFLYFKASSANDAGLQEYMNEVLFVGIYRT